MLNDESDQYSDEIESSDSSESRSARSEMLNDESDEYDDAFELSDSSESRSIRPEMLNDESDQYSDEKDDSNENSSKDERNIWEPRVSNWHSVQEVINRQIGSNSLFHRRFYGSLVAVGRLSLVHQFTAPKGYHATTLNFNQEGNLLANACADTSEIFIWDWAVSKKHSFKSGHTNSIRDVKWLPLNTEYLVTCARDGVRLLNLNSNISEILAVYDGYRPEKLAVHPEMPYTVFTAGRKGKVVAIDVREKKRIELFTVFKEDTELKIDLHNIHFNPLISNEFIVSGYSKYVRMYDCRNGSRRLHKWCPNHLKSRMYNITYCVYNHNGQEILASYEKEDIYLFDKLNMSPAGYTHKYKDNRTLTDAEEVIFFGPKSEYVISGSRSGYLFIWDKNTKALTQVLKSENHNMIHLKAHPFFPILATQMDKHIGIWMPLHGTLPRYPY